MVKDRQGPKHWQYTWLWGELAEQNNTHLVTAAHVRIGSGWYASGGTSRQAKRSGKASSREPGATPGSWWPIDSANNAIVRAKLPLQTPTLPASSWRRGGRGASVTATSKPLTMPTMSRYAAELRTATYRYVPEMRGQSPCPHAVRISPGRQNEKRLQLAFHARCCWPVGRHAMVRSNEGIGPLGDQLGKPPKRKY